jgi:hypothetical protein
MLREKCRSPDLHEASEMSVDLLLTVLAAAGGIAAVVALFPATLNWIEARRQRLLTERTQIQGGAVKALDHAEVWDCGIFDYPPLSTIGGGIGARPAGPLFELAELIFLEIGRPVTYSEMFYRNLYREEGVRQDVVVTMFDTKKRSEKMIFSCPINAIGLQGLCRIDQEGDILRGLREGPLRAAVHFGEVGWEFASDELKDAFQENRVLILQGGHQMDTMSHLRDRRCDVVLMDKVACELFLRRGTNRKRFKFAFEEPPMKYESCIALKPQYRSELERINASIVRIRNTDRFIKLEDAALKGYEMIIEKRGIRIRR